MSSCSSCSPRSAHPKKRTESLVTQHLGHERYALGAPEKVFLLLPGEMADVPTDAVHWQNAPPGICVVHAFESALEFAAREPELRHKRVRHRRHSSYLLLAEQVLGLA